MLYELSCLYITFALGKDKTKQAQNFQPKFGLGPKIISAKLKHKATIFIILAICMILLMQCWCPLLYKGSFLQL